MKIALIGYGKMGRAIEEVAETAGDEVIARIDPNSSNADFQSITSESINQSNICFEFTTPETAFENCMKLIELGKPVVCGSTGWLDHLNEIQKAVEEKNGSFLYAANFSVGVNLFYRIVKESGKILNAFEDFDPYIFETHHMHKKDGPSGTAIQLGEILKDYIKRKNKLALERLTRPIADDEISISAARAGGQPGTHTVGFEGEFESITLTHANRNRASLAKGAHLGATWLHKNSGFYTFDQVIEEMVKRTL